ncbi:hypothetical protein JAAARDRAFT_79229 [Jaapia argillacea MUCL 33604]|uniref:Uncharacterized protein n=1 Tax=Jaapia argillacea MUCL 33604 TaxID=933084 RepID=A0A067PPT5_9AGAM|nr:hypothetical protein JAAARDRAFT_79229 [Jaapia argillacea MUCL 33604]
MYVSHPPNSRQLGADTPSPEPLGFPRVVRPRNGGQTSRGGTVSSYALASGVKLDDGTGASGKTISAYSTGGGKTFALSEDSPFLGRLAGGGTRAEVYGTSRYGSGYPYGDYGTYVDDRPFPFLFYPIPIYPDYYGSDVYANLNATQRPGGEITVAIIIPQASIPSREIYRIIGDQTSVSSVISSLISSCSVQNTSITPFNSSSDIGVYPLPEQIIQWYRASSFGLSLDTYNNSASLPSNMPPSNSTPALPPNADTPLPLGLNQTWLQCINTTIGASLPLADPPRKTDVIEIVSLVLNSLGVTTIGIILIWVFVVKVRRGEVQWVEWVRQKFEVIKAKLDERKRTKRERLGKKKIRAKRQYSKLEEASGNNETEGRVATTPLAPGSGGESS